MPAAPKAGVTVRQAARELELSVRAVQADVARGCPGIVRPGEVGRGKGALLELDEYRAWRRGRGRKKKESPAVILSDLGQGSNAEHERARAWAILSEASLRVWQEHGGVTRQHRRRSAELMVRLLARVYPALAGRELADLPPQMRTLLRVLAEWEKSPT